MSTKIYNGYILSIHDWKVLRTKFKGLRLPFDRIKESHLKGVMSRIAVNKLDRIAAGLDPEKPVSEVLYDVKSATWEEMIKSEKSATRNYPYDCDSSVTVIPLKTKTLCLFYGRSAVGWGWDTPDTLRACYGPS